MHHTEALHAEYSDTESEYDNINTLELTPELQTNAVTDERYPKRLFATLILGNKPVKFQIDSGATRNIITQNIPAEYGLGACELKTTNHVLTMYNKSTETPLGQLTIRVMNPQNSKSYETEFVVLSNSNCTPLLGSPSSQQMELIKVHHDNILALAHEMQAESLIKDKLMQQHPDVFHGTGRIAVKYHLEIDEEATPVVHPPR